MSHAVRRYSDPGVRPGTPGRPRCCRGHPDAQLEGEHQRVDQHHDPDIADAGSVDGLRVVQLRRLQLYRKELSAVAAAAPAGRADRHGPVLRSGAVRTLSRHFGAQMYSLGGQPPSKGAHGHRCGGLLHPGQPPLPRPRVLVHQRSHHCLPDHRPAGQQ